MGPEKDDNVGERNQRKVGNNANERTEVIRYMCEQQRLFQPRPGIRRGTGSKMAKQKREHLEGSIGQST